MLRNAILLGGIGLLVAIAVPALGASTNTAGTAPPGTAPPVQCAAASRPLATPRADRPVYRLSLDIHPAERRVSGEVAVRFATDLATDRLVFRLWANRPAVGAPADRETVSRVAVAGRDAPFTLVNPTTLVVPLAKALAPGESVEASVSWDLSLAGWKGDRISLTGTGANTAVRLGSFFPILPWEPGHGWALDPPIRDRTETSTTPIADFTTTVRVPAGLTVFATGVAVPTAPATPTASADKGAPITPAAPAAPATTTVDAQVATAPSSDDPSVATFTFSANAVRDVAVSVGRFRVAEGIARAPDPVRVIVGVQAALSDDPALYVRRAVRALEEHARRFGPYPWPQYTIALTPDLKGGIEYPMHVMQGPGSSGRSTPHEVGHMWFYALVGNDQATDPWLDEGLATWAEVRSEGTLAVFLKKVVPIEGKGRLGAPMSFWDSHVPAYYRSVYVQGTQALASLGPPEQVDCALRAYVAENAYGIARPAGLIRALTAQFPGAAAVLARYGVV